MNALSRLRKNLLRRYVTRSMVHIPILAATLSGETKKAESPRTTHQLQQRCKQPDMPAMQVNILHTSVTNLRSSSHETIQPLPSGYKHKAMAIRAYYIHIGHQVAYVYAYASNPRFPFPQ